MYSTFFGECSSLKKRSYHSQWDFKLVLLFVMLICQVHTCAYQEANCIESNNFLIRITKNPNIF